MFLLSDDSRRIARLESRLRLSEEKVNAKKVWDLPAELKHPEGLVFVGTTPIVGIDEKGSGDSIFVLEPLN